MSTQGAGGMQVEKVLDDLITRLTSRGGPEARAALIEARRLRNVTTRWAAIPPPPDARREMLSRVMDLVAKAGGPQLEPATLESAPTTTLRPSDRPKKPVARASFDDLPPLEPRARQGASKSSPAATRMGYDAFADPGPTPRSPVELEPDSVPPDSLDGPRSARRLSPHRGPTIAGIPESMEPRAERASAMPTLAPTPPSGEVASREPEPLKPNSTAARLGSIAPPASGSNAAESFRRETLMMGAGAKAQVQSLVDEILGEKASPASETPPTARPGGSAPLDDSSERDSIPAVLGNPPSVRRHTNPLGAAIDDPPASRRGAELAQTTMTPGARSSTPIDGLSTSVSSPRIAAQSTPGALSSRKRSNSPTQALFSPLPPPVAAQTKRPISATRAFESPVPPRATPGSRPAAPAADRTARTMLSPGVVLVHPDSALWQPHAVIAGITVKVLFREPRSGMCTSLVRLAPGAALPRRRHAASEELLVVSGVATIGTTEIRAGEYCRAEMDTEQDAISTTSGCTLFISGSEHDEYLEEA